MRSTSLSVSQTPAPQAIQLSVDTASESTTQHPPLSHHPQPKPLGLDTDDRIKIQVAGIKPVVANDTGPNAVAAQSQLIEQHQAYNQKIIDLLSQQMTFQRFTQAQLKKAFPQLTSIDP